MTKGINKATTSRLSWYLKSLGDHDTHHGSLREDGTVLARCGISFTPQPTLKVVGPSPGQLVTGPLALRGNPPDPEQVCPRVPTWRWWTVIQMSDRVPGERARLIAQGHRGDDGSTTTLVIIHEDNGPWSIHGLGAPGVTLSQTDMITVAESILARAR